MTSSGSIELRSQAAIRRYNISLLLVAGLGGLLYGIDVGIIGGALPYLEATSALTSAQLSVMVAAVLLGSVFSTLFSGLLADWMGRKPLMIVSGCAFVDEHPGDRALAWLRAVVFWPAAAGHERRTDRRGGSAVSGRVPGGIEPRQRDGDLSVDADAGNCGRRADRHLLQLSRGSGWRSWATQKRFFHFKDHAWRSIFWVSLPPGVLVCAGQPVCDGVAAMAVSARRKENALMRRCCAREAPSRPAGT